MQPVVPAAKWEESVRKMIKTYGAPIPEENVAPIVQYLVAFQQAPSEGLVGTITLVEHPAMIKAAVDWEGLYRGRDAFARDCASCHGPSGKGDGSSAPSQLPHPTDLTSAAFSDASLSAALTN